MIKGLWGKKIGMTQMFSETNVVVPVTVIDASNWYVTQIKTADKDGYNAIQVGRLKNRFVGKEFSTDWLKKPATYFSFRKEVKMDSVEDIALGTPANLSSRLAVGDLVDVTGITKGCGFAGVNKRHDFNGPPASHGSTMGNRTGSLGFMRSRGRVIKGKRMPGHMGVEQQVMQGLQVIKIEPTEQLVIVKGSVPGKAGSLVFVQKA